MEGSSKRIKSLKYVATSTVVDSLDYAESKNLLNHLYNNVAKMELDEEVVAFAEYVKETSNYKNIFATMTVEISERSLIYQFTIGENTFRCRNGFVQVNKPYGYKMNRKSGKMTTCLLRNHGRALEKVTVIGEKETVDYSPGAEALEFMTFWDRERHKISIRGRQTLKKKSSRYAFLYDEIEQSEKGKVWDIIVDKDKSKLLLKLGNYFRSRGRTVYTIGTFFLFETFRSRHVLTDKCVILSENSRVDMSEKVRESGAICIRLITDRFDGDVKQYEEAGHIVRVLK